ncbi:hypothetical protein H3T52_09190, partial [Commensalibacter sp. M0402]|uniref:hypothetical protein n=1 Tax=Commensalibacter melissae TaxID=2070537 RepID=UPI0018DB1745
GYFLAFIQVMGREYAHGIVFIKLPDYRWHVENIIYIWNTGRINNNILSFLVQLTVVIDLPSTQRS